MTQGYRYQREVIADSPLRYWKLDDSTGVDAMSNGNLTKGSSTAAPTTGASGKVSTAWSFDGGDLATGAAVSTSTAMSVEFWFKVASGAGGGGNYVNTFWRADGTHVGVIRMQGTSHAAYPGEVYCVFNTLDMHSGTRYDNNAWHHVVVTVSGVNAVMYVDGVQKATSAAGSSSYSIDGTTYIGTANASEYLVGSLDEIAVYNTALSSTRVSAHYDNSASLDNTYIDTAATASATMPGGVRSVSVTVAASAATESHEMANAQKVKVTDYAITADVSRLPGWTSGSNPEIKIEASYPAYFKSSTPSLPTDGVFYKAFLRIKTNASNGPTSTIAGYRVTNSWTESSNSGVTDTGTASGARATDAANTWYDIDVSSIVSDWLGGSTNYGVSLKTLGQDYFFNSRESSYPPLIAFEFTIPPDATVTASPATGSVEMASSTVSIVTDISISASAATESHEAVQPAVDTGISVIITAVPATITGDGVSPSVEVTQNPEFIAEPFTASAVGPQGYYSSPVVVDAMVSTASLESVDPVITTELNALVSAGVATENGMFPPPIEAQNPLSDPYYVKVLSTIDSDDNWYRLNELVGTNGVADINHPDGTSDGDLFGTVSFDGFGPLERRTVSFANGYFVRRHGTPRTDVGDESQVFTFEVTLRTTEADGMLAYGIDSTAATTWSGVGPPMRSSIFIRGGKIVVMYFGQFGWGTNQTGMMEFEGFKNVADGEWHHIVVALGNGGDERMDIDNGLRIYVDGELDRRKRWSVVPEVWSAPDSWFGMADSLRTMQYVTGYTQGEYNYQWGFAKIPIYAYYQFPQNFVGDVMETVYRRQNNVSAADINGLYYNVWGWVPINAPAASASAVMTNATTNCARRRVLVIWHNVEMVGMWNQSMAGGYYGTNGTVPSVFDHSIQVGEGAPGFMSETQDELFGMEVIPMGLAGGIDSVTRQAYRDPVTDLPRLLNLQTDVDMNRIDLILFRNWPDTAGRRQIYTNNAYLDKAFKDFLDSVKLAVVNGCALEVTNPYLAEQLGLISSAQPIPAMSERGYPVGHLQEKDAHSASIDPWAGQSETPIVGEPLPPPTPSIEGDGGEGIPASIPASTIQIIPETDRPEGQPLGRYVNHDPRSRNYAFKADPTGLGLKSKMHVRVIPIMNQGGFGACTGFAAVGALGTSPLYATVSSRTLDETLAMNIYSEATKIDPFPGEYPPDFTGSDGLSVAKVMKSWGYISGYEHAFGIDAALAALQIGPVITGINWYQGFDHPDKNGFVSIAGTVVGGHEVCVVGIDVTKKTVTAANSWGNGWGKDGFFTFSWADWARLLSEFGDATILTPRDIWAGRDDTSAEDHYLDTHANNYQRVVATVENLTDIPGAFMADAISTRNMTNGADGQTLNVWSYKITDSPDGLVIGDKMSSTVAFWNKIESNGGHNSSSGYQWNSYVWAIAPDGLNVGTPVYKFSDTIWNGNTLVANPYAEYIGGAIVQPGDTWGGVRIAGKVWINFAEEPSTSLMYGTLERQIVPPNAELASKGEDPETEAQRAWDYSQHRTVTIGHRSGSTERSLVLTVGADGQPKYVYRKLGLDVAPSVFEKFAVESVIVMTWAMRGIAWLTVRNIVSDGSKTFRPLTMESTGTLVNPSIVAQHGVTVVTTAAQGLGEMVDPYEAPSVDEVVHVFAAEAFGYMTGYGKTLSVDPFLASGELVDNFDMIHAGGEQLTLYLYNSNEIDLYLKEDK